MGAVQKSGDDCFSQSGPIFEVLESFSPNFRCNLVVEEEDYVAVLDGVFAPFGTGEAGGAGADAAFMGNHIGVGNDFGADKTFLDIGVDFTGGLGCGRPFADCPGAGLDVASGDVGDEVEEAEGLFDEPVEA